MATPAFPSTKDEGQSDSEGEDHSISGSTSRENIIGLVNIRDFALLDTESGKVTVRSIMNFYKHRYGTAITSEDSSYDVFNLFKKGTATGVICHPRRSSGL